MSFASRSRRVSLILIFLISTVFLIASNNQLSSLVSFNPFLTDLLFRINKINFTIREKYMFLFNTLKLNLNSPGKTRSIASLFLLVIPILYLTNQQQIVNIPQLINKVISKMSSGYRFMSSSSASSGSRFGTSRKSKEARFALKQGGELGGISNDGNTCFMNSVIQSLASSRQLLKFIDSYLYQEIELDTGDLRPIKTKSNQVKPELVFTRALKKLFDDVNGAYGTRGKEFSTKPLLNKMPNGPKQNFFSGYNQEDAQEFYQLVMSLVEREYKKVIGTDEKQEREKAKADEKSNDKYIDVASIPSYLSGFSNLGKLGKVYVPASQVDPNLEDCEHKVFPLNLVTPVDGISAERIGCVSCGEVGGIRYSVTSGLSLNFPSTQSYYSTYTLEGLMNDWITPELIDDVNCNRCGLMQTKEFILEKLKASQNEKLSITFSKRIEEIDTELAKNHVTDEAFEKLTINQMIRKTRKSKQILLSRPPPLLSIHINRSVFDPRTYMIVKNSSNVTFPAKFNLSPFVAEPNDINMDARLPFRKQDERSIPKGPQYASGDVPLTSTSINDNYPTSSESPNGDDSNSSHSTPDEDDISMHDNTEYRMDHASKVNTQTSATDEMGGSIVADVVDPKLVYDLKAVVSHYGTHNYGHYICYRKLRGSWWRISDESVYVVTEHEVLNSQGTFMIFYEFNDGFKEDLQNLDSDDEESEPEPKFPKQTLDNSSEESSSDTESGYGGRRVDPATIKTDSLGNTIIEPTDADANEYESSGLSDDEVVDATRDETEYNVGEERAFHI